MERRIVELDCRYRVPDTVVKILELLKAEDRPVGVVAPVYRVYICLCLVETETETLNRRRPL